MTPLSHNGTPVYSVGIIEVETDTVDRKQSVENAVATRNTSAHVTTAV